MIYSGPCHVLGEIFTEEITLTGLYSGVATCVDETGVFAFTRSLVNNILMLSESPFYFTSHGTLGSFSIETTEFNCYNSTTPFVTLNGTSM